MRDGTAWSRESHLVHVADEGKVVVKDLICYIVAEKHCSVFGCSLKEELSFKEFEKIIKQGNCCVDKIEITFKIIII